ncbi:MAG: hypothetical protein KAY24_17405 [Candidatus Eisenbacteria sp.]|nr:hypothetical protein [Candidatus Eisenbacteria bacterium]
MTVSTHVETREALRDEELAAARTGEELHTARETQTRFLPKTLPRVAGYSIWACNLSSLEVSGDYFDIIDRGETGPLIMAVADVCGKDERASALCASRA